MNRICLFSLISFILCSCSERQVEEIQKKDTIQSCILIFNGDSPQFSPLTRGGATNNKWQDNDQLYIIFSNGTNRRDFRIGTAIFDAEKTQWHLFWEGDLNPIDNAGCEVYYLNEAGHERNNSIIIRDVHSIFFSDERATYQKTEDEVFLSANLAPKEWRIRFTGDIGTTFNVKLFPNVTFYSILDFENANIQTKAIEELTMSIHEDGYSNYIYGFFGEKPDKAMAICVTINNVIYTIRINNPSILVEGMSAIVKLPQQNNANGWTISSIWDTNLNSYEEDENIDEFGSYLNQEFEINLSPYSQDENLD